MARPSVVSGCITAAFRRALDHQGVPAPLLLLWSAARADRKEHTRRSI
jgi:hypothetical protein